MDLKSRSFRAVGYPLRLHAGANALGELRAEVERQKAKRAFVISGRTVATETDLLARIGDNLGPLYAGAFSAMDKDSSWPAVQKAVEAARAAEADLLIALGGGSVIVGTRAIAILLSEKGDAFSLMTQYPEGKPAYSPRLLAPKPPIINVVTTPTTAMNRAGTGLKNEDLDHRMEFFDPKTRPCAIFWDADALLTAPATLIRSTAATGHSSALRALGTTMNPLVEADRRQAFHLLNTALPRVMEEPDNAALRIDLCAAAFLQNRADDDDQGRRRARDRTGSNAYALATALHIRYDHVWQGEFDDLCNPGGDPAEPAGGRERGRPYRRGAWRLAGRHDAGGRGGSDRRQAGGALPSHRHAGPAARPRYSESGPAAAGAGHAEKLQRQSRRA